VHLWEGCGKPKGLYPPSKSPGGVDPEEVVGPCSNSAGSSQTAAVQSKEKYKINPRRAKTE